MWAMYGKPSGIKLRLDFDRSLLFNNNTQLYFDREKKNKIPFQKRLFEIKNGIDRIVLSDVAYFDKENIKLKHNANPFQNLDFDESQTGNLTGLMKYDAWEFEKETRFNVRLGDYKMVDDYPEYIYIGFGKDLISSFNITYNPWMSDLMKKEIKKSLDSLAGTHIECVNSANDGEIEEL